MGADMPLVVGREFKITRQNATYDRLELTYLVRVNGYSYG